MSLPAPSDVRAIVFDYGNTLIPFGESEIDHCNAALGAAATRVFGPYDARRFKAIHEEDRLRPYRNGYLESQLSDLTRGMVTQLFNRSPTTAEVEELARIRLDAFVEAIRSEEATHRVLTALRARYRLGLLSNYPCGRSIRASLAATGLDRYLTAVVVSGDIGFVKPHPAMYQAITEELGVAAHETVFVGDNWLADVQGSKRAGMACVHMRRWIPPEPFDPEEGDYEPDAVIDQLEQLLGLLHIEMHGAELPQAHSCSHLAQ